MTILFRTKCSLFAEVRGSNPSRELFPNTQLLRNGILIRNWPKAGWDNCAHWYLRWCALASFRNGSGCWISRRASLAPLPPDWEENARIAELPAALNLQRFFAPPGRLALLPSRRRYWKHVLEYRFPSYEND